MALFGSRRVEKESPDWSYATEASASPTVVIDLRSYGLLLVVEGSNAWLLFQKM